MATNTAVGTATTRASARVTTQPRAMANGHSARPHRQRFAAGTQGAECVSTAAKYAAQQRKFSKTQPAAHTTQAAAAWAARTPGRVDRESIWPPATSRRKAPAATAAGRLM
jgi:hypothetical protein